MILTAGLSVKDDENRKYVLDEIIGQGGFGYVFKAHRESDNFIFAVKTMLPSFGDSSAEDISRQNQESAAQQEAKQKSNFCKLVYSQFENTIIGPIVNFAEKVNSQYAGSMKITFSQSSYTTNNSHFSWKMNTPPKNSLTIKIEAILKENHKREVLVDRIRGENRTRTEHYIPQYEGKNILAWGEVSNQAGYGFNLLLLDSGEIYGDWVIMNNKNNFSNISGKTRREPFPFSLQELQKEIHNVQVTHLYSSIFEPFSDTSFLNLIKMLAVDF